MRPLMPTTLFFTDVVGNESAVKGALILVQGLQFRASGFSSTSTALPPRTGDLAVNECSLEEARWDHLKEAA